MRHSPGLAFPDDPERRSRAIAVFPGKVCFKEGRELVQGHGARAEVRTVVLGLQAPPRGAGAVPARPGSGSGRPRRLRGAPARWQPWSPPRREGRRARRAPRPRSRGSGRRPRGPLRRRGAAVGTQARGYRVQVTKGRGLLEAVQVSLPGPKWGLVPSSPTGDPGAGRLRECPTGGGHFQPWAIRMHAQSRGRRGRAARSCGLRSMVGCRPAYPALGPFGGELRLNLLPYLSSRLGRPDACSRCVVTGSVTASFSDTVLFPRPKTHNGRWSHLGPSSGPHL